MKYLTMRNALGLAFILYILLVVLGFCSCKAVEKYKASDDFAADCAAAFPVKTDSIYVHGEARIDTVTTYNYGVDTVVMVVDSVLTKYVYKDRIITRTVNTIRVDTLTKQVENTALVKSLMAEIDNLEKFAAIREHKIGNLNKYLLWLIIALLAAIGLFFAFKRK